MTIQTITQGNIFVIQPVGNINMQVAIEFQTVLTTAIEDGFINFVFDLSEILYISSHGLNVILKIIKILSSKRGIVNFAAVNPKVRIILVASGLLNFLDEFDTVEKAIEAINDEVI